MEGGTTTTTTTTADEYLRIVETHRERLQSIFYRRVYALPYNNLALYDAVSAAFMCVAADEHEDDEAGAAEDVSSNMSALSCASSACGSVDTARGARAAVPLDVSALPRSADLHRYTDAGEFEERVRCAQRHQQACLADLVAGRANETLEAMRLAAGVEHLRWEAARQCFVLSEPVDMAAAVALLTRPLQPIDYDDEDVGRAHLLSVQHNEQKLARWAALEAAMRPIRVMASRTSLARSLDTLEASAPALLDDECWYWSGPPQMKLGGRMWNVRELLLAHVRGVSFARQRQKRARSRIDTTCSAEQRCCQEQLAYYRRMAGAYARQTVDLDPLAGVPSYARPPPPPPTQRDDLTSRLLADADARRICAELDQVRVSQRDHLLAQASRVCVNPFHMRCADERTGRKALSAEKAIV